MMNILIWVVFLETLYLFFLLPKKSLSLFFRNNLLWEVGWVKFLNSEIAQNPFLKLKKLELNFLRFTLVINFLEKDEFKILTNANFPIWVFLNDNCIFENQAATNENEVAKEVLVIEKNYKVFINLGIRRKIELPKMVKSIEKNRQDILQAFPKATIVFDRELIIKEYNKEAEKLFNLNEIFIGKDFGEFLEILRFRKILPEILDFARYKKTKIEAVKSLRQKYKEVMQIKAKLFIEWTYIPSLESLTIFFDDVSELFHLRQKQHFNEVLEKRIFDSFDFGILVFDQNHNLQLANKFFNFFEKENSLVSKKDITEILNVIETKLNIRGILTKNLNNILNFQPFSENCDGFLLKGIPLVYGFFIIHFYPQSPIFLTSNSLNHGQVIL